MIRLASVVVIAALTAGAFLLPAPEQPEPGVAAAVALPPVAICPVDEGGGLSTRIGVVSTVNGQGQFTAFAGGAPAGSAPFQTGASGSTTIALTDVAAVGRAAGLVELPGPESASATTMFAVGSLAQEACLATPDRQTLLAGGSTASGQTFDVQLMNPYAGEAVVGLTVQSENGIETASQLQTVSVPSRSSVVLPLTQILPGRERLSILLDTQRGSVLASARLTAGTDQALWNAVPAATDWFVPIPSGGTGEILITTAIADEVAYQLDVYGTEGLVEAAQEGTVPARGTVAIDVASLGPETSAVRVISTQPVVVNLRSLGADGVALTSGATVTGSRWLLPGAGSSPEATGSLVLLNTGLEDATVVVTASREESVAEQFPVPAGQVVEFSSVDGGANGYSVKSDGSLVALWVTFGEGAKAFEIGVPLIDE